MPITTRRSGSVLLVLYACIGMVAIIGVAAVHIMQGPVKTMSTVTRRTVAENHMMAAGRLALVEAARQNGDCDHDGVIEPLEWRNAAGKPAPMNGGLLPSNIGAQLMDPWGQEYGYCAWDEGSVRNDISCGDHAHRLTGSATHDKLVIAIISAGPDQKFDTGCQADGASDYLLKMPDNDDVVMAYTYADAMAMSGGLWNLKEEDTETATIAKNLSVTDQSGHEQLSFDAASKDLSLGSGGTGHLPNIKTDYIQNLTANAPVEFLSNIKTGSSWISGDGTDKGMKIMPNGNVDLSGDVDAEGQIKAASATISTPTANAVAAIVTASGTAGIGLKAIGSSKAIESNGLLDMVNNKIVNLSTPTLDTDAATKKYVDDKISGSAQIIRCESFASSGCSGGTVQSLTKTNLGACKKACETAGVQCCEATYPAFSSDPNAMLSSCKGYSAPSQPSGLRSLLAGLFGTISSYCYLQ